MLSLSWPRPYSKTEWQTSEQTAARRTAKWLALPLVFTNQKASLFGQKVAWHCKSVGLNPAKQTLGKATGQWGHWCQFRTFHYSTASSRRRVIIPLSTQLDLPALSSTYLHTFGPVCDESLMLNISYEPAMDIR